MKPIELTHATWKTDLGSDVKVYVYPQHIYSVMYMPESKAVAVQSIAGAYQAVLESEDEINKLISTALNGATIKEK